MSRMRYDKVTRNSPSRFLAEVRMDRMTPVNMMGKPKEFRASAASGLGHGERDIAHIPHKAAYKPKPDMPPPLPAPKNKTLDFVVGDRVTTGMTKYGEGEVLEIRPAGADYEVTILFETVGRKKFMSSFAKIVKVEE
jgi:DNA helicase-2/ATP-dependent DNA helicase PcrA